VSLPEALLGLDFSCAPSARKPLTLAWGRRAGAMVRLDPSMNCPATTRFPSSSAQARQRCQVAS